MYTKEDGKRYLGAAISGAIEGYMRQKAPDWLKKDIIPHPSTPFRVHSLLPIAEGIAFALIGKYGRISFLEEMGKGMLEYGVPSAVKKAITATSGGTTTATATFVPAETVSTTPAVKPTQPTKTVGKIGKYT